MSAKGSSPQPVQYVPFSRPPGGPGVGGCFVRLFLGSLLFLILATVAGSLVGGTLIYANWTRELDDRIVALEEVPDREVFETTHILDRNGDLLWEIFGEGKRTRIPLSQMPAYLVQSTIAVEDDTFFENSGVDAPSLVAALIASLRDTTGRPVGGSTITQQLVRHLVFNYEERAAVSIDRKVKEIVLAWIMNRNYSKDEILEMYLNEINYGNLAYGVEAAANAYFGKSAADLTLAEASLLAALPQSPYGLDPYSNLEGAKARQWLVLNLMVGEGYITRFEAEVAYQEPLVFEWQDVSLLAPHFSVYVRQQIEEMFGSELVAEGGIEVTTTLDLRFQELAEQLAAEHVAGFGAEHNMTNASMVVMKPGTGEILAMLGSVDYYNDEINGRVNIALSEQQPASTVKPLTYAAALSPNEDGIPAWTPADLLWDVEVDYGLDPQGPAYSPVNYDERFRGPLRLRDALANSYNVPAILLLQDVGVAQLMDFAQKLGIESWQKKPSEYGLSLALGSAEVTPLELTTAYAAFANGGRRVNPVSILRVTDKDGTVLYEQTPAAGEQVIDPRVAYLVSDILDDDSARTATLGTDNPLVLPFAAAAKLGTSSAYRDAWAVGYTPGMVATVWTGNTDNSEMIDMDGESGAAPLWSDFMRAVHADGKLLAALAVNGRQPPEEFERPDGLSRRLLCALTSVTPGTSDCRINKSEWLLEIPQDPEDTAVRGTVKWEEVDPAVIRVPALPLLSTSQAVGTQSRSATQYCRYDEGLEIALLDPETVAQVFLTPPRNIESVVAANIWAQNHGLVMLPARPCTGTAEVLADAGTTEEAQATVWRIANPDSGQTINGTINIIGTANFQPNAAGSYAVDLGIPEDGDVRWVALGGPRTSPVINGALAVLDASTLAPGDYFLRLSVSQNGVTLDDPYVITVRIGGVQTVENPAPGGEEDGRVVDVAKIVNPTVIEEQPQPEESAPPPSAPPKSCTSLKGCD
jgi:membrane peptidoglycan carboxypeptidase